LIISVHQPHFFPWLGYFNKVVNSDIFIWLNNVQYRKNYFQNRTKIKNTNEIPLWLTIPVHTHLQTKINEVTIADNNWSNRIQKIVESCYHKTPFFYEIWPSIVCSFTENSDKLDRINYEIFCSILDLLELEKIKIIKADEIEIQSNDPTNRLVELCKYFGANYYIAGKGGRNYMDTEKFENEGIKIIWQSFNPEEVKYSQFGKSFVSGLSILDCLFNVGVEKTREIIINSWRPKNDY